MLVGCLHTVRRYEHSYVSKRVTTLGVAILTDVGVAPAMLFLFSHLRNLNIGILQESNSIIVAILFTKENTAYAALVN